MSTSEELEISSGDSSDERIAGSSTPSCTSLSLTTESDSEGAEIEESLSRKRKITRKRPRGLKYRKELLPKNRKFRSPSRVVAQTAKQNTDAEPFTPDVAQEDPEEADLAVHSADNGDESEPNESASDRETDSSGDIDELSSLSSFRSVSSGESPSSDEEDSEGLPNDHDSAAENQDDRLGDFMKDPLYEGARLSVFECCTLIMLFVIKHRLTKAALQDLLYLIQTVIPSIGCKMVTSIYRVNGLFSKFFGNDAPTLHYMCSNCGKLLKQGKTQCTSSRACKQSGTTKFAELNVEEKLKELFLDEKFCNLLSQLPRTASGNECLQDIYDGSLYKEHISREDSFLQCPWNISFTLNTDGVSVFSSSKKGHLWPVYLAINELPIEHRYSKKYLIPALLYCDKGTPNMQSFLKPLVDSINNLYTKGVQMTTAFGEKNVHAMLMVCSLDLPAKAALLNMKQFNGANSCSVCDAPGQTFPGSHLHRFWPFDQEGDFRKDTTMRENALNAAIQGKAVLGVKGASPLAALKGFDLVRGVAIDYMHNVLIGVVKSLQDKWFNGDKKSSYYIGKKARQVDKGLLGFQVPDIITRKPRSVAESSNWKATERKSWLLHYSLPVLRGILKPIYSTHFALLATAIAILTAEVITTDDLEKANMLLMDFCTVYPELYGQTAQSHNLHLLRHLAHIVATLGPLWAYSCFGFESMNAVLKNLIHGTGKVISQVSLALGMLDRLPKLCAELTSRENVAEEVKTMLRKLTATERRIKVTQEFESSAAVGKVEEKFLDAEFLEAINLLIRNMGYQALTGESTVKQCHRMQIKQQVFYSSCYPRTSVMNSHTVEFRNCNGDLMYGEVVTYVIVNNKVPIAIVRPFKVTEKCVLEVDDELKNHNVLKKYVHPRSDKQKLATHIKLVDLNDKYLNVTAIPVTDIIKKCVYGDKQVEGYATISRFPNLVEHD